MRREPFNGDFLSANIDQGAFNFAAVFERGQVTEGIFASLPYRRRRLWLELEDLGVQPKNILKSTGPRLAMGCFATEQDRLTNPRLVDARRHPPGGNKI